MGFSVKISTVVVLVLGLRFLVGSALLSLETDKEALLSFKAGIFTDLENPMATWDQNTSPCNWSGVSCGNLSGRVAKIDLAGFWMTGTISPYLGNLSFLESLELQQNMLTGTMPGQLCDLSRLRVLNVSFNILDGGIPSNSSRWNELTVMDLKQNRFSGPVPQDISYLSRLQILSLEGNNLSSTIPSALANLSSLVYLNLGTNGLVGPIPSDFSRLTKLELLDLSVNLLSGGVPPSVYNMSSLVHLRLASNQLWGQIPRDIGLTLPNLESFISCFNSFTGTIPPSLHNITNIEMIRISNNLLHGGIPPGLGNLPKLEMYYVAHNSITTFGPEGLQFLESLTNCTQLHFLAVDNNMLEGTIPPLIGNFSKGLKKLYMGGNNIYGTIPPTIGELVGLELLSLFDNSISGEIPQEIGLLEELKILELSDNRLYGTIPSSLGNLRQLTKLDLSQNKLTGEIPGVLGNLQCLISLDLSFNELNGAIPLEIFRLPKLSSYLNLSQNHLTGPLPALIGSLSHVDTISISDNKLSGSIPISVAGCRSLEKLLLARNMFSGRIPHNLDDIKGLETLDLSSNLLTGAIPVKLQELKALRKLNLSFNRLEGRVPKGGIFLDPSKVSLEGNLDLHYDYLLRDAHVRGRRKLTFVYVLTSISSVAFIAAAIGLLYYMKRSRMQDSKSYDPSANQHELITYADLRAATDDFNEENMIGRGGYGRVYKGHLHGLDLAIKVLDTEMARSRKSFLAECVALKHVRHRNLVKIITTCSSVDSKNDEFLALIFQFMSNGNLDDWIRGNKKQANGMGLSAYERLSCAIGIASAIDYLHNETDVPIVHCDLKPSNVLLDSDMTPKVADFGLAKLLLGLDNNLLSFSFTQAITGSIGYIPPEYGFGRAPSTAGDVYSFGILLLELFTGKSPTDDIFMEGLSLRSWVEGNFQDNLEQILDLDLLQEMKTAGQGDCLSMVLSTGLSCAVELPNDRIDIREALRRLKAIEKILCNHKHKSIEDTIISMDHR